MPMMASAVYSEDKMQLILMLWGIPWERMTLGEANRLTIVGFLIQNAVCGQTVISRPFATAVMWRGRMFWRKAPLRFWQRLFSMPERKA